jgi:hypothetical protein
MDEQQEVQNGVELACSITLTRGLTKDQLEQALADYLNGLINHRFSDLVRLLYRVDIDEARLRSILANQTAQDAGVTMARLIIERQWQKIETRKRFKAGDDRSSDEEKW